ncbi:unnamed protein product [Eruca vesicaria subsp. sativa]|uniref:Uncharacterized protein n=1 Tax=Eruca vesicaria subsp. sativa TaxID=29727 RepID=A0ABC8LSC8_ERUVS|nr:unnamed protein product [Eruca vesicaria subsp. sativa]
MYYSMLVIRVSILIKEKKVMWVCSVGLSSRFRHLKLGELLLTRVFLFIHLRFVRIVKLEYGVCSKLR